MLWNLSLFAGSWKLWIERNNPVFNSKSRDVSNIVDSIVWTVLAWASRDKAFHGVFMYDIYMSWEVYFRGGASLRCVHPSSWLPPPNGLFKLNFDGNFIEDIRKGGYGGVIKNSMGDTILSFQGLFLFLMLMQQRFMLS